MSNKGALSPSAMGPLCWAQSLNQIRGCSWPHPGHPPLTNFYSFFSPQTLYTNSQGIYLPCFAKRLTKKLAALKGLMVEFDPLSKSRSQTSYQHSTSPSAFPNRYYNRNVASERPNHGHWVPVQLVRGRGQRCGAV